MTFWRPRILIIGVALVCAIIAVERHFSSIVAMQKNMSLQAKVLTAFQESHTGMLAVDADSFTIAQANEAACDIFGFKKGELAGQDLSMVVPAAFRKEHADKIKAAMAVAKTGRSRVSTVRCFGIQKDGTLVDVYVHVFVTRNGVMALVSLASETSYTTMGVDGTITLPKPVSP